jgi:hypothetical protein
LNNAATNTQDPAKASSLARPTWRVGKWMLGLACGFALSAQAAACAVCMGSDDAQIIEASNAVLWSLLSLVGFVFAATAATAWFLWRKAHTPIPPHIVLIESLAEEPDQD